MFVTISSKHASIACLLQRRKPFQDMKKLVAIAFLLVYFTATTGATITMHYCMGELRSGKLWHAGEKKEVCPTCGMEKKAAVAKTR